VLSEWRLHHKKRKNELRRNGPLGRVLHVVSSIEARRYRLLSLTFFLRWLQAVHLQGSRPSQVMAEVIRPTTTVYPSSVYIPARDSAVVFQQCGVPQEVSSVQLGRRWTSYSQPSGFDSPQRRQWNHFQAWRSLLPAEAPQRPTSPPVQREGSREPAVRFVEPSAQRLSPSPGSRVVSEPLLSTEPITAGSIMASPRPAVPRSWFGEEARSTCPHCGNVYLPDSRFCRRCGQRREPLQQPVSRDRSMSPPTLRCGAASITLPSSPRAGLAGLRLNSKGGGWLVPAVEEMNSPQTPRGEMGH